MAYVSLYRKYRPQSFGEVVGQDHVIRTLVHAIQEDRLHHAYLFTGPRGTGKTSTARILAKAVNCEQGPTPEPCGTCDSCVSITNGSSVDVIELDMASHGGVDDARELRERALFAPARARRKVYILDEVHMASTAAFNALLKLIEEPPGHVLFAMATTDPQKVLPTILSRVQRLDLRRLSADQIAGNVRRLCDLEGYAIEPAAVEAIVRAGDGSLRDTQSVLEQVLAFGDGEVTAAATAQVLGLTPAERVIETVELLASRDLAGLLAVVQGLLDDGHDLRRFTLDLVQHLRDLLVLQVAPDRPDLVDATDERRVRLLAQSDTLPQESMLRAVEVLAGTIAEQRQGSPRLPLELALAQLAVPGAGGDVGGLADRVARLEADAGSGPATRSPAAWRPVAGEDDDAAPVAEDGDAVAAPDDGDAVPGERAPRTPSPLSLVESPPEPADPVRVIDDPADDPAPPAPRAATGDGEVDPLAAVQSRWGSILELVKERSKRCYALFAPATVTAAHGGILTLRYTSRYASFHADNARKSQFSDILSDCIAQACGLQLRVDVVVEGEDERRRPVPPSVTPDDARTPVLDVPPTSAQPPVSSDEEAEVREAEHAGKQDPAIDVDQLLAAELDAELVDEQPPADQDRA